VFSGISPITCSCSRTRVFQLDTRFSVLPTLLCPCMLRPSEPGTQRPLHLFPNLVDEAPLLRASKGELRSTMYLRQRIDIALQRGNSASVLGTLVLAISPIYRLNYMICAVHCGILLPPFIIFVDTPFCSWYFPPILIREFHTVHAHTCTSSLFLIAFLFFPFTFHITF